MIFNQEFRKFFESLKKHNVRYLLIGGYAVALHGHPRYTKGLDIWIWMDHTNAINLLNALKDFGFSALQLSAEDFLKPDRIVQLGYPPNRIDLMTSPKGIEFDTCYASREEVGIEELIVNLINLKDLKLNKKATGRHQDLADLDNLQ
jgi:Aminoglycoside-2''-adenylyltransferase